MMFSSGPSVTQSLYISGIITEFEAMGEVKSSIDQLRVNTKQHTRVSLLHSTSDYSYTYFARGSLENDHQSLLCKCKFYQNKAMTQHFCLST